MSKNEFDALLLKKIQEEALEYNPSSWQQLSERLNVAMPVTTESPSFDSLLAAKIQEETFEYNPGSWQELSKKLETPVTENEPSTKAFPLKKWGIAIGTAAAVCLVFGLAIKFTNNTNNVTDNGSSFVQEKSNQNPPAVRNSEQQQGSPTPTSPLNSVAQPANVEKATVKKSSQSPSFINQQVLSGVPHKEQIELTHKDVIVDNKEIENSPVEHKNSVPSTTVKKDLAPSYLTQNNNTQPWPEQQYEGAADYRNSTPKTNVSFGGGVNYGNLNTGYTAGVSVKRKITNDFFVDGTVAMMYNNNASNVAANKGPSVVGGNGNTAARPSSFESSISSPALDPIQRLYYVQVNPSIGYQIEDKVALSVGGDFQRILNKKDEIIQPNNADTKVFPNFDVGITTKSEFTISPNVQAGLVYREGLNNLLKGDGGKYVNRRYFQVQFKYNLPIK